MYNDSMDAAPPEIASALRPVFCGALNRTTTAMRILNEASGCGQGRDRWPASRYACISSERRPRRPGERELLCGDVCVCAAANFEPGWLFRCGDISCEREEAFLCLAPRVERHPDQQPRSRDRRTAAPSP